MSAAHRRRWLLWMSYSLSIVVPLLDAMRGAWRDRDLVWLYHPIACAALGGAIAPGALDARRARR
jgi:hypothetical protein